MGKRNCVIITPNGDYYCSRMIFNYLMKNPRFIPDLVKEFGVNKKKKVGGLSIDHICFDEYESIPKDVWDKVIKPVIDKSKGGMVIGTPGMEDYFYGNT